MDVKPNITMKDNSINIAKLVATCISKEISSEDKVNAFSEAYCVAKRRDLFDFTDWRIMERLFDWELTFDEKKAIIKKVDWECERITFPRAIAQVEGDNIIFSADIYDILGTSERAIPYSWKSKRLAEEYKKAKLKVDSL